ncbi:MAG: hypothetical protein RLZZ450_2729, partial [Pseudomonadota bacterium]
MEPHSSAWGRSMTAPLSNKEREAQENWRRLKQLWSWTGGTGTDVQIERAWSPHGLTDTLPRARTGNQRAGGKFQRSSVNPLAGFVLGVDYKGRRPRSILQDYAGPGDPDFVAHLQSLTEPQLIALAERWVDYLTREVDEAPPDWRSAPAPALALDTQDEPPTPTRLPDVAPLPEQAPTTTEQLPPGRSSKRQLGPWLALAAGLVLAGYLLASRHERPPVAVAPSAETSAAKPTSLDTASAARRERPVGPRTTDGTEVQR